MKKSITYLVLIVLLASCRSNTIYDEPIDLIPKDTMVMLLKDLYLASSAKSIKNRRQQRKVSYITLVYHKYNIDSLRFTKSNLYYTSKIDVYEPMLNEITELLEKEQAFFKKEKKIKDSIFNDSLVRNKIKVKNKKIINSIKCKKAIQKANELIKNKGRLLVRPSGTEPKVRIMCESFNIPLMKKCLEIVKKTIH